MPESPLIDLLHADLSVVTRERILELEKAALSSDPNEFPRLDCPVRHHFTPGLYAREIFLPKGTFVVGKIHLKAHFNVILGDVSFASTAEGLQRVTGCETLECPAGIKRAAFAHEDTWWTTFHANPTDERDLAKLEAMLIASNFEALDASGVA